MTEVTDQAQQHYLEGLKQYGEDNYPAAAEAQRKALEEAPDWTDAMHGLSMALMHAGQVDEAIAIGKRICELDPEDAFAHTSLSMFYQRKSVIAREEGELEVSMGFIEDAEREGAKARMISWKEELKKNPDAPPPGPAGSMDVIQ
ncbi:MAG TPA: tetratricopeptide repeat protein [Planctomycetes bacterium]|nr:tetratricopeptide repeat protein [Planctomycetota bacterium]HIK61946.1 tetratricopeptide repeat protein [Planctomycetota bacterium]